MKLCRYIALTALHLTTACTVAATDYFVSTSGADTDNGSKSRPWASLRRALDTVGPGDTVFIRGGRYHEEIKRDAIKGTAAQPITIRSYPSEQVTLDGTIPLKGKWIRHERKVFVTDVAQPIWQLFVDGKMMMPARWPNARFDDDSLFSRIVWAGGVESLDKAGFMVNDKQVHDLGALGVNVTGSVVVANINSCKTYVQKVTSHVPGSNEFNYTMPPEFFHRHHHYYLEGSLKLLDQSSEWHIDNASGKVYLWAPNSRKPKGDIRGRVQQYVVDAWEWEHVVFDGIKFFGTTMHFENCGDVTVRNCEFLYSGSSRRALGIVAEPASALSFNSKATATIVVQNITVRYSDSHGLFIAGKGKAVVENCLFDRLDWSAAQPHGRSAAVPVIAQSVLRHNTISRTGSSEAFVCGRRCDVSYNHIHHTGYAQNDGALIQVPPAAAAGAVLSKNWLHDTTKYSIRFDGPNRKGIWGVNGTVNNNVVWRSGGLNPKGDEHRIYANTAFDNTKHDIMVLDDSELGTYSNNKSRVINNAAGIISSQRRKRVPPSAMMNKNVEEADGSATLASMLQNPADFDFRPRSESALVDSGFVITDPDYSQSIFGAKPDVGAYELGADEYFIPGRQEWKASFPVPSTGRPISVDVPQVMWRPAYEADKEVVLLGTAPENLQPVLTVAGGKLNAFRPGPQASGTYFWRVDSVVAGREVTGDVWTFTVAA